MLLTDPAGPRLAYTDGVGASLQPDKNVIQ